MRIVYFGSPRTAVAPLVALHEAGHDVALVISGSDKRRGRGSAKTPTPVKAAALELGLDVSDDMADALEVGADLGVVVAYGRIIPNEILAAFPLVNIHFSLLPRWRGAAPIERAILAGDTETGVCLMEVAEGLDTGDVYRRVEVPIDPTDTATELHERLSHLGARLLLSALDEGLGDPEPQSEDGLTYASKVTTDDRRIDANMTVEDVDRRVRVGGAWTTFRGRRLKIISLRDVPTVSSDVDAMSLAEPTAESAGEPGTFISGSRIVLSDGVIEVVQVQPEGKPVMDVAAWANGADPVGDRIGS